MVDQNALQPSGVWSIQSCVGVHEIISELKRLID